MTTDAYFHPEGVEINLSRLADDLELYTKVIEWYGRIKRTDPPVLTCLSPGGNRSPMFLAFYKATGKFFAKHYNGAGCGDHAIGGGESDAHKRIADYAVRAAENVGLTASREVRTGGRTIADAGVVGKKKIDIQVQLSPLTIPEAKRRTTQSFNVDWISTWIHDKGEDDKPAWDGHVPMAVLANPGIWQEKLPALNTENIIIHKFWRERDKESSTKWTYAYGPIPLLYDHFVYLMSLGAIEPVRVGKFGIVTLAYLGAGEIIDSVTYPGASLWIPGAKRKIQTRPGTTRPCFNPHRPESDIEVPVPEPESEITEDDPLVADFPSDALDEDWLRAEPTVVIDVIPLRQCDRCGGQQREPLRFSGRRHQWMCVHCWASDELPVWGYDWSQRTWAYRKRSEWRKHQ